MDSSKEITPIAHDSEDVSPIAKYSIFDQDEFESNRLLEKEFDPQDDGYEPIDINNFAQEFWLKGNADNRPATRLGRKPPQGNAINDQLPEINETNIESEKYVVLSKSPEVGLFKKKKQSSRIASKPTLISYTSSGTRK